MRVLGTWVIASGCWTGPVREAASVEASQRRPVELHLKCESPSKEASLAPADGGYRRLDSVGRDSLRAAIDVAARNAKSRYVQVRGTAFKALAAAVHDTRDELVACLQAAEPDVPNQRAKLRLMIDGERHTGALVASVAADGISSKATQCIADILTAIELPPSDGPGYADVELAAEDPCVGPIR